MLTLRQITKVYSGGEMKVNALRGIDLEFGESEFAAILGPSGCGKTTLLNIIGGLDQYTEGDLIIRGKSTKQFKESDWDTYRNHAVGFVFQSYNLIPHQTVLANVELALTLSGIGREERRRRAKEALEKVGLADQIRKKPNELSGGQMQRVAIARALVNNPEILLADEPTGALDSETSIQVMEILREIGRERLVIMVTHNPDLANEYADRIIRLLDGKVISDSHTVREPAAETPVRAEEGKKKRSMSFLTALNLSLTNLMTKKGRTLLTAFAGSIGIIGIALILAISHGVNAYIERVQRDTLSAYPLEIEAQSMDMTETLQNLFGADQDIRDHEDGKVYSGTRMTNTMSAMMSGVKDNDLVSFKAWLDDPANGIDDLVSGIQYEYETPLVIYRTDHGMMMQVNPSTTMDATGMMDMWNLGGSQGIQKTMMDTFTKRLNVFEPLLDNEELLASQYEILYGRMPEDKYEVVMILNNRNELSDYTLYSLGLKDQGELREQFTGLMQGEGIESVDMEFTYEDLMGMEFKLLPATDLYVKSGTFWKDRSDDPDFVAKKLQDATQLKIVGVIRPSEGTVTTSSSGTIGYKRELMEEMIHRVSDSEIVQEQLANPGIDVFTGQPFSAEEVDVLSLVESMDMMDLISLMEEKGFIPVGMIPDVLKPLVTKDIVMQFVQAGTVMIEGNTLEANLEKLGVSDESKPTTIMIYPKNFESKKILTQKIKDYNASVGEEKAIQYTDVLELIMSSVTTIVNAISYVLIAFVAISLIVSSIMIGIITYISVLERTKEIGILRSIGASRRDVARVFNAETLIVGFGAGVIGIAVTLVLIVIANVILKSVTGIPNLASLPPVAGVVLVLISMALTLIAGIIPSQVAARKDPVVALRSE